MHIPVLQNKIMELFDPKPGERFIDCTANGGGHSIAIAKRIAPQGKLLAIDMDHGLVDTLRKKFEAEGIENVATAVQGNFRNCARLAEKERLNEVDGILFDLGMSSEQLESSGRGFSFMRNEPLDMRFDRHAPLTAEEIVNSWPKEKIKDILRVFGEEGFYHQIGDAIYEARRKKRIVTTSELVAIVDHAVPAFYKKKKIHFATKTFQALRIAVNDELENIKAALPQALALLKKGGRLAVISFHGLEDKIVKDFMKYAKLKGQGTLTAKKPITPDRAEIIENPRARSAKLRVLIRT